MGQPPGLQLYKEAKRKPDGQSQTGMVYLIRLGDHPTDRERFWQVAGAVGTAETRSATPINSDPFLGTGRQREERGTTSSWTDCPSRLPIQFIQQHTTANALTR